MFHSEKKIFIDRSEIEYEFIRKSTINRIEELTLQLIEEIHFKTFPKLTYCDSSRVVEDVVTVSKAVGVQEVLDEKSEQGSSHSLTSIDTSKSLSWIVGESQDDEKFKRSPSHSLKSIDTSKSLSWVVGENQDDEKEDEEEAGAGENENFTVVENVKENVAKDEDPGGSSKSWTTVDFKRKRSRKNLILIVTVMSEVHKMMINGITKTRRSFYYELQNGSTAGLAPTQKFLDEAVNHVASILNRAPWELGFTATSKGLLCGNLSLTFFGGETMTCGVSRSILIPQNIFRTTSIRTTARCVLVVEKDSVFQKLLQENCVEYLNCILITGKGYPDVNTRMLVALLGNRIKIPVYILVDSDPFGVEIMCIYRFGSTRRVFEQRDLICPGARWIGIHPSEYSALYISPQALTDADKARLSSLESREYVNEKISEELKLLRKGKVEIETVANLSYRFLTAVYLPSKIEANTEHI